MRFPVIASFVVFLAACSEKPADSGDERILPFESADLRLASHGDTVAVRVELALSNEQKTLGLMERRHLTENAGMLFVYDSTQPPDAGFWMYRTRIPLDIAFIDSAGVIRAIVAMVPCESTYLEGCPTYQPNVPYRYALEVNSGFFQRHGVAVGDFLLLRDLLSRAKSGGVISIPLPPNTVLQQSGAEVASLLARRSSDAPMRNARLTMFSLAPAAERRVR